EKARSPRRNSRYNYRFPHPIYRETSSYKQLEIINLQDEKHPSAVGSDKTIDRPEGIRATGTPRFEFHFKDVSYKEIGWGDTPYIRSPEFKQVRGSQVIPIILSHKDSRLSPGRGLDDENRLVTSIPAYSCGGSTSLLFKNPLRGCTATADELALWPLSCAVYVLDDNELDSRNPSFQRRKSRGLPGRFPDCSSKSGGPKISGSHDGKITRNSRLAIEPKQELRRPSAEGARLVVQSHFESDSVTQGQGYTLLDHRRSRQWLGSPTEQRTHVRNLDNKPKVVAFQQKRTVGSIPSNKTTISSTPQDSYLVTDGQSNCSGVHPKGRGYEVPGAIRTDLRPITPGRRVGNSSVSSLLTRKIQWYSRQAIQRRNSTRMALKARGNARGVPEMGSSRNRLICKRRVCCSQSIRLKRLQGSVSRIYRCLQSSLGLQPSLGLSTTQPVAESTSSPQQMSRLVPDSRTQVGTDVLDGGLGQPK
ncbi:GSCOCG00010689001-RA-CDS, partial [Cotesia congregata]